MTIRKNISFSLLSCQNTVYNTYNTKSVLLVRLSQEWAIVVKFLRNQKLNVDFQLWVCQEVGRVGEEVSQRPNPGIA